MTQSNATTSASGPVFPPGRYGRRRAPEGHRHRRWLAVVLAVAVVAAGFAVALRLNHQYGAGPYDAHLVRYTDVTDSQVIVQFWVNLPAGRAAVCAVRARNRAGAEVGRAQVRVPAGPDHRPTVSYRLVTSERPVIGEVQGCGPG